MKHFFRLFAFEAHDHKLIIAQHVNNVKRYYCPREIFWAALYIG